ncbi:MAG: OsmC family protein [Candidatus Eremiobacteraeota bacterium]|nr:OsmC family protein [Candidatus Eremiobacteraeota bacterium]
MTHTYGANVSWASGASEGTRSYASYSRDHTIGAEGKPDILASSDPSFRGNAGRYNPEELLVASLSSCHMLWYLHLCAVNGITVVNYTDSAFGEMEESGGAGQFVSVDLRPVVTILGETRRTRALQLHHDAHQMCFIARSVNFPVNVRATIA